MINSSQCNESTIESGAHVGPFAYIRPNCHVGRDVKVGDFVELKKLHHRGRDQDRPPHLCGDADVGHRVNFGCGTVLVNYDGNRKYRTTIGGDCFIGCNTKPGLPGPCGETGPIPPAGSTITEDVPADALAIAGPVRWKSRAGRPPTGPKAAEVNPSPLRRAVGPEML